MVFDFVIFVMTVAKLARFGGRSSTSLYLLLLRDGSMSYFVLTALKVANLIMFIHADVSSILSTSFFIQAICQVQL